MIKVVIIEDEVNSREVLEQMLTEYCPTIKLLGIAVDVASGIGLIKEVKPDLVFLDVEMPGGTGFDILNEFEAPDFRVIFVTGYDHYAIKAIRYSAIDYLLKPINLTDLEEAVTRLDKLAKPSKKSLSLLQDNINKDPKDFEQFVVSDNKKHKVLKVDDILFVEAERTYVVFHLSSGQKLVATHPLQYYEEMLPSTSFFRIHKSYLVNCKKVEKLETGRGGPVHLNEGIVLPVAFRRKPAFVRFLGSVG